MIEQHLVAGGGIVGLACAVGLARQGHRVTVLERAASFAQVGAGIPLAPNALAALAELGLLDAVMARSTAVACLQLRDAVGGAPLLTVPMDDAFRRAVGRPFRAVHRADLLRVLQEACRLLPQVSVETGASILGHVQNDDLVRVLLSDGRRMDGLTLIAADGLRSTIREGLVGDGPPDPSGHTAFHALVPAARMPASLRREDAVLWAGPGFHVLHLPLAGGQFFDVLATVDDGAPLPLAGTPLVGTQVRAQFPQVHPDLAELLLAEAGWRASVLADRPALADWSHGRVLLVGDAAHPMLPYAGQGVCQALADAATVSQLAAGVGPDGWPRTVAEISRLRAPQAARVQGMSRALADDALHLGGPAADERDRWLASMAPEEFHRAFSWLISGEAPAAVGECA